MINRLKSSSITIDGDLTFTLNDELPVIMQSHGKQVTLTFQSIKSLFSVGSAVSKPAQWINQFGQVQTLLEGMDLTVNIIVGKTKVLALGKGSGQGWLGQLKLLLSQIKN